MTIPTHEIQALRARAQAAIEAAKPERLVTYDRRQNVRHVTDLPATAVVAVQGEKLAQLIDESPSSLFAEFEHPSGEGAAHWPAAQILELCDVVLERRQDAQEQTDALVRSGRGPTDAYTPQYNQPATSEQLELREAVLERRQRKSQPIGATFTFKVDEDSLRRTREDVKLLAEKMRMTADVAASMGLPPVVAENAASRCFPFPFVEPHTEVRTFKAEFSAALEASSPGTPARIKAALLSLPFVDSVRVEENRTLDTVDGMPPKSVRVTIGPNVRDAGRLELVRNVLLQETPAGLDIHLMIPDENPHAKPLMAHVERNPHEFHCGDDLADSHAFAVKAAEAFPEHMKRSIEAHFTDKPGVESVTIEVTPETVVIGRKWNVVATVHKTGDFTLSELDSLDTGAIRAILPWNVCFSCRVDDESTRRVRARPMAKVGAVDGVKARTFAASDVKVTLGGVKLEPAGGIVIEPVQPGEPTEADRRERLRREMAKGKW